ncbi:nuclease [Burkholderia paludis]|uniref:Nuclease n=1 Tax=Burkholderia paludis TaxID=1506587 RepID=A0A6P2JGK0_9BURK|nr:Nucleoid occlusion protein [Burkholderia paludis]VWB43176.1 nuclease [Burkholderia paludis]
MNAVLKTEAIALETAAPLEVADPTKNLILVPLSQLLPRRSKRNVRTTPRQSIPELAASIARVGLLQNLIVIVSADGEQYEVVAGDRRLTALKLLAKKKRIAADYEVPCLLVADASARTVSLAENVQREAMHPADQFAAFAALVKEGRPVEDIAADFGVSPLVVQRRLKLANVSPRLLTDYRAGAATLEQLMALTITDDHAAQETAYYGAPEWQRGASALRDRLTEREITATHPLVRFVGLDAYTHAGGGILRDLFAEGNAGTYLTDAALLETLVRDKLDAQAEDVRAEGWAWVEAVPHMNHAERQSFQNAPRQRREPTSREARRIASLQNRLDKLDAELEEAYDTEDGDKVETLEPRREQVAEELQAIEDGLQGYAPDVRAVAGAIVTLDREGDAVIHRGLLREAEAKALRTLEKLRQGFGAGDGANDEEGHDEGEAPKTASLSDRLAQRLSAHRTAALQIEVARHPHVALAALVHGNRRNRARLACERRGAHGTHARGLRQRDPSLALYRRRVVSGLCRAGPRHRDFASIRRGAGDGRCRRHRALDRRRHVQRRRRRAARERTGEADPFGSQDEPGHHHEPTYLPAGADVDRKGMDGLGVVGIPEGSDAGLAAARSGRAGGGPRRYRPIAGEDSLPLRD